MLFYPLKTLIRIAITASIVAFTPSAFALKCAPQTFTSNDAKEMFGPARLVFTGTLQKIDDKRSEGWYDSALGTFSIQQAYKGNIKGTIQVRINANLPPNRQYIVYAEQNDTELHADAPCWPKTIAIPDNSAEHLAFLNALPAQGAGGEVVIQLSRKPASQPLERFTLDFEGTDRKFSVTTDKKGMASIRSIAAGTYRLASPPPKGYRFQCNGTDPCDKLVVHDRSLDKFQVEAVPSGIVQIRLQDAQGQPVHALAQFDLYDATTKKRIGLLSDAASSWHSQPFAAKEPIVPGRYLIALVTSRLKADELRDNAVQQSILFNQGAKTVQQAKPIDITVGTNEFTFTLPQGMKPVRTEFTVSGHAEKEAPAVNVSLLVADKPKPRFQSVNYQFHRQQATTGKNAFWSLPGQSWKVQVPGYRIEGGDKSGAVIVTPTRDDKLPLKLVKENQG